MSTQRFADKETKIKIGLSYNGTEGNVNKTLEDGEKKRERTTSTV